MHLKLHTCCVELDDDLIGHLDDFWGSSDRSTGNDASVLSDGGCLNDSDVQLQRRQLCYQSSSEGALLTLLLALCLV
jgi:hypothetical protein